ncbi:MAG: cell wall-binding repeat-containing protein, partial [Firmicutes bacterium]|nr:cell wall-binding repeat-containing protein [Bacillota bacterium]
GDDPALRIDRIAGSNRFQTAFQVADKLLEKLGSTKFNNVVIASGANFPDALAGAYLAEKKRAPLLLANKSQAAKVAEYVKDNMVTGGTVYILGGNSAVPEEMEAELSKAGITKVKRLKGTNRYLTNLEILKEAGVDYEDILVCSGAGYADSLSASATGRPILLVGNKLTSEQKAFLESVKSEISGNVYAIGGKGVVSDAVFEEVCAYATGEKERLSGSNRYLTSKAVADKFYPRYHGTVVLAYAQNYPDGLSGGPLAYAKNSPLLLVDSKHTDAAKEYALEHCSLKCVVLGGPTLISDEAALAIVS